MERGGIEVLEEAIEYADEKHISLGVRICDREKARSAVRELMLEVQRIKSTGDGQAANRLMDNYGTKLNQRHVALVKENYKKILGECKGTVELYPDLYPQRDAQGKIQDVRAVWPNRMLEKELRQLELAQSL